MIQTERHIAVVAATDAGEKFQRGRIKVRSLSLLGSDDAVLQEWIEPCFDWGWFQIPDIGEQVEIEVVSGSDKDEVPGQAFLETPDYRYRAKRFYDSEAETPKTPVNEMFTSSNYGKRRGFATPGGHILMFDDTEGFEKINFVWHSAADKYGIFSFDEDGSVIIANQNGSLIYLNAANGEVAIIDEHGNSLSTNSNGIKLVDKSGNLIDINATDGVIQAQAGTIYLGGTTGVEAAVLAEQLLAIFRAHIHSGVTTGPGFSGPPVETPPPAPPVPGEFDVIKSAAVQLK